MYYKSLCRRLTFRKAYKEVGDLVIRMNVPVLVLTATITKHMQNDTFQALHLDKCKVVAELPNRYVGHMNIMTAKIEIKRAI